MRNCVHTHMDDTPPLCTHFADPPPPYSAYVIKVRSLRVPGETLGSVRALKRPKGIIFDLKIGPITFF